MAANNQVPAAPIVIRLAEEEPVAPVAQVVPPQENAIQAQAQGPQMPAQNGPEKMAAQLKNLKEELETLKATKSTPISSFVASLALVRQLESAPRRLRDPAMMINALQRFTTNCDNARVNADPKAAEYEVLR